MQWRAIGQLSGIAFGSLYTLFARWTRLGLWRRLLDRLRRMWRLVCADTQPIARGRDGVFIPTEIAWVVERSFSWISRAGD